MIDLNKELQKVTGATISRISFDEFGDTYKEVNILCGNYRLAFYVTNDNKLGIHISEIKRRNNETV
jgi:hypothetical protein